MDFIVKNAKNDKLSYLRKKRTSFDVLKLFLSTISQKIDGVRVSKVIFSCNLCSQSYNELVRNLTKYNMIVLEKNGYQKTIRITNNGLALYELLKNSRPN